MLKRNQRISKKNDFRDIFKFGKNFSNNQLILKVLPNGLEFCRFAVVISLKISKKAVERNRMRRRIMEIIRANEGNIKKGFDLVFVGKPELKKSDFKQMERGLADLIKKSGLYV
jgi:ribonuclease P protein component